jgi:hypothetical protein
MDISVAGADNLIVMDTNGVLYQFSGTGYGHDYWRQLEVLLIRQI